MIFDCYVIFFGIIKSRIQKYGGGTDSLKVRKINVYHSHSICGITNNQSKADPVTSLKHRSVFSNSCSVFGLFFAGILYTGAILEIFV